MPKLPILVLQMQRMGDLILSFPLFLMLQRYFPGHPIWVAAEENFYKALMPVAPEVTFFPSNELNRMHGHEFHLVINLSHRPQAAALGPLVKTEKWIGPRQAKDGSTYVHGNWQLYRASLTHNNRHNQFHWAELNLLDVIPYQNLRKTVWTPPELDLNPGEQTKKIGVFLGASEPAKRPSAAFWAELVKGLLKRGLKPILLGGNNERPLGREVGAAIGSPQLNLCGRFSVPELVKFTSTLRLLITPDTGPMHLAAWLGIPVLNLSLGHVNPWDTAPYQPGHLVLRSSISCRGCWYCPNADLRCHQSFVPGRVVSLTNALLNKGLGDEGKEYLNKLRFPGQELFFTSRKNGLYWLNPSNSNTAHPGHNLLGSFWQTYFGSAFGLWAETQPKKQWKEIANCTPWLLPAFNKALSGITKEMSAAIKHNSALPKTFWESSPPLLRPLTSYLQMLLQNGDYTPQAFAEAMQLVDFLSASTETN